MDTDSSMQLVVLACLIFLSAIFSSSETAFLSANKIRLRNLQEDGEKKAALVLGMLENQNKLISALLVGNNIVNIGASALATNMATIAWGSAGVGIATGIMTCASAAPVMAEDAVNLAPDATKIAIGE